MTRPLTVAQAADALGISERQVERLVARMQLARLKIGRSVRIELREIEAFKDRARGRVGERKPTPIARRRMAVPGGGRPLLPEYALPFQANPGCTKKAARAG